MQFQPQNKYRYYVTPRSGYTFLGSPTGEAELKRNFERDKQGYKAGYTEKFTGQVIFHGEDFQKFYLYERSEFRCELLQILIERRCDGAWEPYITASINLNDGNWDLDNCVVAFPLVESTPYDCFERNKDVELNLLSEISVKRTLHLTQGTIETYEHTNSEQFAGGTCVTTPPAGDHWTIYKTRLQYDPVFGCERTDYWAREVLTLNCAITPVGDWTLISDDCGTLGTRKYGRPVTTYECVHEDYTINGGSTFEVDYLDWCKVVGLDDDNGAVTIDNGMTLADILQLFVWRFCPQLTIKSNFFQINPDIATSINYVTGQASYVNEILFFQKSDVKRPGVSGNATKAVMTWEKLLKILAESFNVEWVIDGTFIRFEHTSYFESASTFDMTTPEYEKWVKQLRKYSYDRQEQVSVEEYQFMEAVNADFIGRPIEYLSGCGFDRTKKKIHVVENVTTDLQAVLSHPSADSGVIKDDGFVMVATQKSGSDYYVLRVAPVLDSVSRPNNVLGWAILHRDFHKHKRIHIEGMMNNALTNFLSTLPTKKGVPITIPYCCNTNLNIQSKVTTPLGTGIVDKASVSLRDETIELTIAYGTLIDITNDPPVANNDVVSTVKNVCKTITVLSNDSDDDQIIGIDIVVPPVHGTVEVLPNLSIKYCPSLDYVGDDPFIYRVKDSWGSFSDNAMVFMTVDDLPPVAEAIDDVYLTQKNTTLNKNAADGVLHNDIGLGLVVTAGTFPTSEGGTLAIAADGSFVYTPPVGFTGNDYVLYTITDSSANVDTGEIMFMVGGTVYVRAITDDVKNGLVQDTCDGHPVTVGSYQTRDFRVLFYEDAAASIPMNVTGMGIVLNYKHVYDNLVTGQHIETPMTDNASGFGQMIENDYYSDFESQDCDGLNYQHYKNNYVLLSGTNYTII